MRVGWARFNCFPGYQIGSDENSWAFDGYNVCIRCRISRDWNLKKKQPVLEPEYFKFLELEPKLDLT